VAGKTLEFMHEHGEQGYCIENAFEIGATAAAQVSDMDSRKSMQI